MKTPSRSLDESYRTIAIPKIPGFWRKMFAFTGPGYLVAVGYMDPGNWATDIAGGSAFGYTLLSVILLSNLMAILLQALSARLGIATGMDLAQACRAHYPKPIAYILWFLCEIAIIACDIAEVIGTAIALQLLFNIPLIWGVSLTVFNTVAILFLQTKGFRYLEAFIISLILLIAICFVVQIALARPDIVPLLQGYIPTTEIFKNPTMLYIAIGILGATVMPHNLYLHSSIVQTRAFDKDDKGKSEAIKFATVDSTVALSFALFINSAILIMAASVFHHNGMNEVAEIQDAYQLLTPLLGTSLAATLFAIALLASGQNSTITATLAGQIVMEGFLHIKLKPWMRQFLTRALALIPTLIICAFYGQKGTADLLVFSQVILSLQLPFAVVPLVHFVSSRKMMGVHAIKPATVVLASFVALLIIGLNIKLLVDFAGAL